MLAVHQSFSDRHDVIDVNIHTLKQLLDRDELNIDSPANYLKVHNQLLKDAFLWFY